jgi:hypothetical protein
MTRFATATILLLFATAGLGQIVSERAVSTAVFGPAYTLGTGFASDGDAFLAVWRNGGGDGIFSTRISRDGTVLDPFGIFLPGVKGTALIWTGDRYLVLWNESDKIMAAQLGTDGRVIAPPLVIQNNVYFSRIASNGKVTLLLTYDSHAYGYSVPSNGFTVLDRDLNVISSETYPYTSAFPFYGPFVTGSGEFLISGYSSTVRLDSSGRLVAKNPRSWLYSIVCRKTECLTAFDNNQTSHFAVGPYDPVNLVNGPPHDLPSALPNGWYVLTATEAGYLFISGDNTARKLDTEGGLLGSSIALPGAGYPSIATNGPDLALLRSSQEVLTATIVTPTGVTPPATVAFSANSQYDIAIARGTSNYLAVWREKGGTYAGRLSLDGQRLDEQGKLLGLPFGRASVIFNGSSYLVALRKESLQYNPYADYTQSIVEIDATSGAMTSVSLGGTDLQIASNGSAFIATWNDHGNLVAAFLSPNGRIASAPVLVASPPPNSTLSNASVGWNGSAWLVAWEEDPFPLPTMEDPAPIMPTFPAIRGARLSAALTLLDPQPMTIAPPVQRYSPFTQLTRVASDGKDFLVAWSDGDSYSSQPPSVHVRRIPATGAPAEPEMLLFGGTLHDLVWDGKNYDLAFKSLSTSGNLAVARVRPSGQPFDTLAISSTTKGGSVSLVPIGNENILAAYTRVAVEVYSGSERAFVAAPYAARGRAIRRAVP